MIKTIGSIVLGLLFLTSPVYAGEPPALTNPTNNATVSSSKLTWETPVYSIYSNDPYRIQVDNDSDFSSVYRDYKTKNTFYTPVLTEGKWYWKIKAKDASGTWSDWSTTWSFNLTTSTPTTTPTPSPTPTPLASTTSSTSSFTISNLPSQINSDQSFNVSVNLSIPNNPNTTFYLKGAFKTSDSSNYFGQTKVSGAWVKNGSTYSSQLAITTDSSGNWSGNLEVKPDIEDSGFTGSGDYIFKVGRYTSSGSGPTWSNEQTIKIIAIAKGSDSTETISDNSPSSSSTTSTSQIKSSGKTEYKIASVAGVAATATPSSTPTEIKSQKQTNLLTIIGIVTVIIGTTTLGYAIYNWFCLRNKEVS